MGWNLNDLVAIDIHTHATKTAELMNEDELQLREAMRRYFRQKDDELSIAQIADYYRARKIACIVFSVDNESRSGFPRFPNEDVAEAAAEHSDIMIAFG